MLFVGNFVVFSDVIVFNVLTKDGTITIEVDGIFITLVWIEDITNGAKASEGLHIKKSGYQHPTRKLESLSRAFREVQGNEKHIFAVGETNPRQLDKVEKTSFLLEFTLFPFNFVHPEDVILVFLSGGI